MDELIQVIFSRETSTHIDVSYRRELLKENLGRIFASQGTVESWEQERESGSIQKFIVASADDFASHHTTRDSETVKNRFFFITQGHSWSRLQVSAELMLHLVAHYQISPLLMDFVHCFGAKVTGDDNPYYGTFYATFSGSNRDTSVSYGPYYDFCCHLRRFERHGNSLMKDPWSLRQMTAYQRHDIEADSSTWMFIKPFQNYQAKLKKLDSGSYGSHPMAPHILCLTMATENWRWYIDFLRKRLGGFAEKATFSSLDASKINYDISISDSQRLHTLESKLAVAVAVLEQSLAIGRGMREHCRRLTRIGMELDQKAQDMIECEIEMQLNHLSLHKTACELLLQRLHGTCTMLLKVLDLRNDMVMKDYSRIATELASIANTQHKSLNTVAHEARRDSNMMRILTFVAIAYVPPNLIASLFSSGLIRASDDGGPTHSFQISKDMWIFVVSSLAVTIATVLGALLWAQRRKWP